jgi:hypothetical protein
MYILKAPPRILFVGIIPILEVCLLRFYPIMTLSEKEKLDIVNLSTLLR